MPNHEQFAVTVKPDFLPGVKLARVAISCRVRGGDGSVLLDATGANEIDFVFRVAGFTAQQHKDLAEQIANLIVRMKARLE